MKKRKLLLLISTVLFGCFLSSCKQEVMLPNSNIFDKSETPKNAAWSAPQELKSTQGKKRFIRLSWKSVKDAVRYNIYRADTPFGEFTQVGETKSFETDFVIKTKPGYDVYYSVAAVDNKGNVSDMSNIVRATTLAEPVINLIEGQSEFEDSNVYVSWYMNNLDAYKESVHYNVVCLDKDNKEIMRVASRGDKTNVLFEGLKPNTKYFYKVEAYNSDNDYEESLPVDASTAHRLRPEAVTDITATQGISKDIIELSFVLPDFVDVIIDKGEFEKKPLYFKIYRRKYVEGDNKEQFELISNDFGINKNSDGTVDYTKVKFGDVAEEYIPGNKVIYKDKTNLERGVKYEYKIQSFAYIPTEVSSELSIAYSTNPGWLISDFSFETGIIKYTYEEKLASPDTPTTTVNVPTEGENPNTGVEKIKVKKDASLDFKLDFEDYGIPYLYEISEIKYNLKHELDPEISNLVFLTGKTQTDSKLVVNNHTRKFTKLNSTEVNSEAGYYQYKISILSKDGDLIDSRKAIGESLVSDSMDEPVIGDIIVRSGYEDRIELEWDYNPSYKYILKYWDEGSDIEHSYAHEEIMKDQDLLLEDSSQGKLAENKKIIFNDLSAIPGKERDYELMIFNNGFGIPSARMTGKRANKPKLKPSFSYDKIAIEIEDPTANIEQYEVTGKFINNSDYSLKLTTPITLPNNSILYEFELVKNKVGEVVTTANNIVDAAIAGELAEINVTQNSPLIIKTYTKEGEQNKVTETEGKINPIKNSIKTALVGPALLQQEASQGLYSDNISVSWSHVLGASGYVAFREQYNILEDGAKSEIPVNTEKYIISIEGDKINIVSENADLTEDELKKFVTLEYNTAQNKFILTDKNRDLVSDEELTNTWRVSQSQLIWGAPYNYKIIPIIDSKDAENCQIGENNNVVVNNVQITNVTGYMGGTKGFGWNVQASKGNYSGIGAEDLEKNKTNNAIKITWSKPYFDNGSSFRIFRREVTETNNASWDILGNVNVSEYIDAFISETDSTSIKQGVLYEYAVVNSDYSKGEPDGRFITKQKKIEENETESKSVGYILPTVKITSVSKFGSGTNNLSIGEEEVKFNASLISKKPNYLIDGYVIQLRNNNIDNKWHNVKTIEISTENKNNFDFASIITNEETKGKLKVLRDYKHYYRIRAYKNTVDGMLLGLIDESFSNDMENSNVRWGSRQITTEEFAQTAIIGMSTGMEKERGSYGSSKDGNGITGLKSTSSFIWGISNSDYKITFGYSNYDAKHTPKAGGEEVSAVKVNGTLYARGGTAAVLQTHYWTTSPIKITYCGQEGTLSFKGQDTRDTNIVSRYGGEIVVTWNGDTKTYNQSTAEDKKLIGTLPFAYYGEDYLNNSEEWK